MSQDWNTFIHELDWNEVPLPVQQMTRRCLLDLLGVAAAGSRTELSNIIRHHALENFGSGTGTSSRLLFDGRSCSPSGAALAGGMIIDSIDAHDGHKLCKGHVGCGVLPGWLAFLEDGNKTSEEEFLTGLLIGYEFGTRAGISLHENSCDYHTSGAWVALAVAALGARRLRLSSQQTREALGIAEFHGPRSQMMRCIDHPTMVKDGSGWGAMAGVSAALMARSGFTGAPAITVEDPALSEFWSDLGQRWRIEEQYFKPIPVCRWAQPGVVAAMNLMAQHNFQPADIASVRLGTFHEAYRLATPNPVNTEQAQYSTPFPVAAALIHGQVGVAEVTESGLKDARVQQLSHSIELYEVAEFSEAFPQTRISSLTITLKNGDVLESGPTQANGDPENPLSDTEIDDKFFRFSTPVLGETRSEAIFNRVRNMGKQDSIIPFQQLVYPAGEVS